MLLANTKQERYVKFLDWILYFCLCGLSAFFMWGVLEKFISGKTSFAESEERIKELPTITLCFSNPDSTKTTYEYGLDFKLKYLIKIRDIVTSNYLIEGTNMTILENTVGFNKFISEPLGNCYKFSHIYINVMDYQYSNFILYFNESVILPDTTKLNLFFTTEKNVFGLTVGSYRNGRVAKIEINKGVHGIVDVQTEKLIYLPGISNCSHESFYECFCRTYEANVSSIKCFPGTLPSYLPICKSLNEYMEQFWSIWNKVTKNGHCPKLCETIQYFAETVTSTKVSLSYPNASFGFGLSFGASRGLASVHEEYLIYDTTSMIGSVGGTLGMCIGFSFTGVTSILTKFLRNTITIMTNKRKPTYSKPSL